MNKLVVVLADTDEKYLVPLEMKFINEFEDSAEIYVITDRDYFKTFFSSPRKIDIFIVNEDMFSPDLEKHYISSLFILSESNVASDSGDAGYKRIFKYTSIKKIFSEVMNSVPAKSMKTSSEKTDAQLIMVYSASGGAGKTTVAIGLAGALALCGKRVLYIDTGALQSFQCYLKEANYCSNGLERHLHSKDGKVSEYLEGASGTEVFDYILPFSQAASSLNIGMEEYKYLIEAVRASGRYDFIIADTSSDFTREKTMLMSLSEKVIIVTSQDRISSARLEYLLQNVDCSDTNKFLFICNMYSEDKENFLFREGVLKRSMVGEYVGKLEFGGGVSFVEALSGDRHFQKLALTFI